MPGRVTRRSATAISTMSPLVRCRRSAIFGLTAITLSQVSLLSGFGNSCSHATLANRPSHTHGSGRNTTSIAPAPRGCAAGSSTGCGVAATGCAAVPVTKPSCSDWRQRCLEVAAEARHPGFPHRRVGRRIDPAAQHLEDLMRAAAAIKRRDQRLDQRDRAVDRAPVAPALERMGERQVPAAGLRGLVGMKPGMDAHAHARQQLGKFQIAGRGIDRIAIQDQERIDAARRHVPGKIGERAGVRRPIGDGLAVPDGGAAVPEPVVDLCRQRLHDGRQM